MTEFAVEKFGFDPDAFVHELVDSIIGDNYPVPDRMLVHNERIVQEYLQWPMCGEPRPPGKFDLYAVEGGTAANGMDRPCSYPNNRQGQLGWGV